MTLLSYWWEIKSISAAAFLTPQFLSAVYLTLDYISHERRHDLSSLTSCLFYSRVIFPAPALFLLCATDADKIPVSQNKGKT